MDVTGKVIDVLAEESGNSKNGTWRKQSFILETQDQYPKKINIMIWGDKIDQMMPQNGEVVTAHINVESREYNGRWYTDVKAWKIDRGEAPPEMPPSAPIPNEPPPDFNPSDDDDLPF